MRLNLSQNWSTTQPTYHIVLVRTFNWKVLPPPNCDALWLIKHYPVALGTYSVQCSVEGIIMKGEKPFVCWKVSHLIIIISKINPRNFLILTIYTSVDWSSGSVSVWSLLVITDLRAERREEVGCRKSQCCQISSWRSVVLTTPHLTSPYQLWWSDHQCDITITITVTMGKGRKNKHGKKKVDGERPVLCLPDQSSQSFLWLAGIFLLVLVSSPAWPSHDFNLSLWREFREEMSI